MFAISQTSWFRNYARNLTGLKVVFVEVVKRDGRRDGDHDDVGGDGGQSDRSRNGVNGSADGDGNIDGGSGDGIRGVDSGDDDEGAGVGIVVV